MIYLDNHATTRCDPKVVEAMLPYFSTLYGNPSSSHNFGYSGFQVIEKAKDQLSDLLNAVPEEINFTSGATESNNIALLGITRAYKANGGKRKQIVTTLIEHKAVLSPLKQLEREGWEIIYIPIDSLGRIDINQAAKIISDDVFLVSIQLANSEIGTIQPISEIVKIAHNNGVFIHCDAAQGVGRIQIDVQQLDVNLLSFSAHKMYGPKGVGCLWIKRGMERIINPIMFGGGSLSTLRPGTPPVALIAGFGKAGEILCLDFTEENTRINNLRNLFENLLLNKVPDLMINGAIDSRLNNNSNLTFPNVDSEALLSNLPDITASTGSACESGSIEPSRVLKAIGLTVEQAFQTVRFGLGRFNTQEEIISAAELIADAYNKLLLIH